MNIKIKLKNHVPRPQLWKFCGQNHVAKGLGAAFRMCELFNQDSGSGNAQKNETITREDDPGGCPCAVDLLHQPILSYNLGDYCQSNQWSPQRCCQQEGCLGGNVCTWKF